MTVELGAFALILALALATLQTGMAVAGRLRRSPVLAGAAEGAALASAIAVALAFAALIQAFAVSDLLNSVTTTSLQAAFDFSDFAITSWFFDVSQNITGCVFALLCSA